MHNYKKQIYIKSTLKQEYIIAKVKSDHPSQLPVRSSRFAMYYPVIKCYTKRRAIDVAPRGDMRLAHLLVDFGFTC